MLANTAKDKIQNPEKYGNSQPKFLKAIKILSTQSTFKKRQSEQYKLQMNISHDSSYNLIPQYSFYPESYEDLIEPENLQSGVEMDPNFIKLLKNNIESLAVEHTPESEIFNLS